MEARRRHSKHAVCARTRKHRVRGQWQYTRTRAGRGAQRTPCRRRDAPPPLSQPSKAAKAQELRAARAPHLECWPAWLNKKRGARRAQRARHAKEGMR